MSKILSKLKFAGALLLVFTAGLLIGQPAADLAALRAAYPDNDAVVLSLKREVSIRIVDNSPEIVEENYTERILLNDNFMSYIKDQVTYSGMVELLDIKAYTLVPDGRKYRKEVVEEFKIANNPDASVFFDDEVMQRFVYPSLQPGAKTVVSYTLKYKEPRLFGVNFFQDIDPVVSSEFTIHAPEGMQIGFKSFGPGNPIPDPVVKESRNSKTYSWHLEKLDAVRGETDVSSMRRFMLHTKVWIASYKDNAGKEQRYLTNLNDLHTWYSRLVRSANTSISPEMKVLTDSLVNGLKTDEERLKAVYYWVQDHVKYVAFEEGYMGLIPHNPSDVFKKRYGDCKDKSLLLKTMLHIAGLEAHLTWIGTRALPYRFSELPCSGSADHMILTWYNAAGKPLFLDATNTFLSWKLPSIAIQEKEAMVDTDSLRYTIEKVPVIAPEVNLTRDSVHFVIDNNLLRGKGMLTATGYVKIHLVDMLRELDQEKMKRTFSSYISKGNDKCKLDTFRILKDFSRDEDLAINYVVSVPDYLQRNGDEIYVNMHLEKPLQKGTINPKVKKFDAEYRYKYLSKNTFILDIPDGYAVDFIPPDQSGGNDYFSFTFSYTQNARQIILYQDVTINTMVLPRADFEIYNKLVRQINQGYNQSLILKKKL
jgi:transglutaminase-like putative cysteine protease